VRTSSSVDSALRRAEITKALYGILDAWSSNEPTNSHSFSVENACSNIAPLFGQDDAKGGGAMSF
jgi:hypothetical protein